MKKLTNILVLAAAIICGSFVLAQDIPFMEPFDSLNTGELHGQNSWNAQRQSEVKVTNSVTYAGGQSAMLGTNTVAWHDFSDSSATNVWVDFYARSSYPADSVAPSLTGSVAAAFFINKDGAIVAVSNTTWVTLSYTVSSNEWHRFSVNLDYVNEKWAIFAVDDTPNKLSTIVATNLAFSASSTNEYFHRFRVKN